MHVDECIDSFYIYIQVIKSDKIHFRFIQLMGLKYGNQILFKADSVVPRELHSMLNQIVSKRSPSQIKRIDCDISNVIHQLSHKHARVFTVSLVRDVANFLKSLAMEGFIVTAILDGDVRPQSKRDAFKRRFDATMSRINSYYCRQSAMKVASKSKSEISCEEKKRLVDLYNREAKALESETRLTVPSDLILQLDSALQEISAYTVDRRGGGYVNSEIVKAEFEADYMMAYRFRNGLSDLVYSTDGDMSALCGPECLCIRYFGREKTKKRNNDENSSSFVFNITGGSNKLMESLKVHITSTFPTSAIKWEPAACPLLEATNPLTLSLCLVAIECDVLPGGVPGVTPSRIWNELNRIRDKENIRDNDHGKFFIC